MLHTKLKVSLIVGLLISVVMALLPWRAAAQSPTWGELPLYFVPNAGQLDDAVMYSAHGSEHAIYFTEAAVALDFGEHNLTIAFDEAESPTLSGINEQVARVNYFYGSDPSQWHANLPTYGEVVYENLYPGIDVHYNGTQGRLKSTYIVAPGVNPHLIRWRYDGATHTDVDESTGDMLVHLDADHTFVEHAPVAWQIINETQIPVSVRYDLAIDGSVGFTLGAYDPEHPLIIDPTLVYASYFGGSGNDNIQTIAVDESTGDIIIGGATLQQRRLFRCKVRPKAPTMVASPMRLSPGYRLMVPACFTQPFWVGVASTLSRERAQIQAEFMLWAKTHRLTFQ